MLDLQSLTEENHEDFQICFRGFIQPHVNEA